MKETDRKAPSGRRDVWEGRAFILLLICFVAYGLAFIYRTSFVIVGERSYALFDDTMISLSFARSLAEGHGLVWFPGAPRIEGFTNLLWVVVLAVFHLIPGAESRTPLYAQLLGLVLLATNLIFVRLLARRLTGGSGIAGIVAVFLTAFYLPLNTWGLQGTEVSALALILTASAHYAIRGLDRGRPSMTPYVLMGIGTLIRLDVTLPLLLMAGALLWIDRASRKRHLILTGIVLAVFLGGQTLFRLAYYGQALPNTYYLKMTGFPVVQRIGRGIRVFLDFFVRFNPLLLILPVLVVVRKVPRLAAIPVTLVLGQCAYSIYVGGDAWEQWGGANRFICIAMPLLFVLIGTALYEGASFLKGRTSLREPWMIGALVGAITLGATAQINWSKATPGLKALLLSAEPIEVNGNQRAAVLGRIVRAITTDDASVGVVWAGNVPYFAHRPAVDFLGRCDEKIARGPVGMPPRAVRSVGFYPGHMKWNYSYSIGELKPDVICHLWGFPDPAAFTALEQIPPDALPFIQGSYIPADLGGYRILVRTDSNKIIWTKVEGHLIRQ